MRMELSLPWKFFETVFAQSHDCWRETVMTCRARGNLPGLARCGEGPGQERRIAIAPATLHLRTSSLCAYSD
jgi:hypothetical protein